MSRDNTLYALTNILNAAEGRSSLAGLDPESRAILKFVGARTSIGEEVCVKDIAHNPQLRGSPVTLTKRIQSLSETGWLVQGTSVLHHRRVTLNLSTKARSELDAVSSHIEIELARYLKQGT